MKSPWSIGLAFLVCSMTSSAAEQPGEIVFDDRPLAEWVQMLQAKDPAVRASALLTFQQYGVEARPALPLLLKLANSDDLLPRQTALLAIRFIDPNAKDVLAPLIESLRFKDGPLSLLGPLFVQVGPSAQQALLQALEHREPTVRRSAVTCLRYFRPVARDTLAALRERLLKDRDETVRQAVAGTLAAFYLDTPEVLPIVIGALKDRDRSVRQAAAGALAGIGEAAIPSISDVLVDTRNPDRAWAANALGRMGNNGWNAVPILTRALEDPLPEVRRQSIAAIANLWTGARSATAAVARLLDDKDIHVRMQAAIAVFRLENKLDRAGAILVEAMKQDDVETRRSAIGLIQATIGEIKDVEPILVAGLRDADGQVRLMSAQGLSSVRPVSEAAILGLANLLKDCEPATRAVAVQTLVNLRFQAKAALPAVVEALAMDDVIVRPHVTSLLQANRKESALLLAARLTDKDAAARQRLAAVLGELGVEAKAAVPALIRLLNDESLLVRLSAAGATGRIEGRAQLREGLFDNALKDGDVMVRRQASAAMLGLIHEPAAPALLALALKDADAAVRRNAARCVGTMGTAAKPLLPDLGRLLLDADVDVCRDASQSLLGLGKDAEPALSMILTGLRTRDVVVAANLEKALFRLDKDAKLILVEAIEGADSGARAGAIAYCGRSIYLPARGRDVLDAMQTRMLAGTLKAIEDREVLVRRAACETLRSWSRSRKDVLAVLARAVKDSDGSVRQTAALALLDHDQTPADSLPALLEVLRKGPPLQLPGTANPGVLSDFLRGRFALESVGPGAKELVPELIKLLADRRAVIREASASILGVIGPEARAAVPALTRLLADATISVRNEGVVALGRIGAEAASAVPALADLLRQGKSRSRVIQALGRMGPSASSASATIAALLTTGTSDLRCEAMMALAQIGEGAVELAKMLRSPSVVERQTAAGALLALRAKTASVLNPMRDALQVARGEERVLLAGAVWLASKSNREALPILRESLRDEDVLVRQSAARVIGEIGQDAHVMISDLATRLNDADAQVRHAILHALGQLGPEAVPELVKVLADARVASRRDAALALGQPGSHAGDAVAVLTKHLLEDEAEIVSRSCAGALGRIGAAGVPGLVKGLGHESASIREASAAALGQVGQPARDALDSLRKASKEDADAEVKTAATEAIGRIDKRGS
jgi:HEAT repeat protein